MKPLDFLGEVQKVRRRNKDLSTRLAQMERSRDTWKARALASSAEKEKTRKRRARWRRRSYTVEQWRQHELIVRRIRAIPNRDIPKLENGL